VPSSTPAHSTRGGSDLSSAFIPSRDRPADARAPIPGVAQTMFSLQPYPHRGAGLLLSHASALCDERPRAFDRLSDALGDELAWKLVFALTSGGGHGRRGSSSP